MINLIYEPKRLSPLIIILGIILVVGIIGGAYYLGARKPTNVVLVPTPATSSHPPQPIVIHQVPSPTSKISNETLNWKIYSDPKAGFSFKYPTNVMLSSDQSNKPNTNFKLGIDSKMIDSIVAVFQPIGATSQKDIQARQEMERQLLQQEASMITSGQLPQFKNGIPTEESGYFFTKVDKIGNIYAADYINTAGYGNACNVHFDRGILFYSNSYRVMISITPIDITPIVQSMPDYFNKYNNTWCWSNSKFTDPGSSFRNAILSGKGSSTAQSWYAVLDQILSTFRFTQ